jgi:hypothetical protein
MLMAEMTIRLQIDPATNKKDIVISLRSDEDALPFEHEQQHRQLVNKLIEGGIISAEEAGKIIVEREETAALPEDTTQSAAQTERESHTEGS